MCVIKQCYELNIKFLCSEDEAGFMINGRVHSTRKVVGEAVEVGVNDHEQGRV